MFRSALNRTTGIANHGNLLPVRAAAAWRTGVVLLSMVALLLMLFAAVSHHHDTAASEDDCIVCNLAFDTLDQIPAPVAAPEAAAVAKFYYLHIATPPSLVVVFHPVAPPSCGPPLPA